MAKGKKTGGRRPGSLNKRTVAVEQAMQVMAEKLKDAVPNSFGSTPLRRVLDEAVRVS